MRNIACLVVTLCASTWSTAQLSDAEILHMGHDKWIASVHKISSGDRDQLTNAEKRFTIALTLRNREAIKLSHDRARLDALETHLANATKGASRIADSVLLGAPDYSLFNAKAQTLTAVTLDRIINSSVAESRLQQSEVWDTFKATREGHVRNKAQIEASYARYGGFSLDQHLREFDSLGASMARSMKEMAGATPNQKQHLFHLCVRLTRLTLGEDPLPYAKSVPSHTQSELPASITTR